MISDFDKRAMESSSTIAYKALVYHEDQVWHDMIMKQIQQQAQHRYLVQRGKRKVMAKR